MTPAEVLTRAADLIEAAPKLAKGVYNAYAIELDEHGRESGVHVPWDEYDNAGPLCYCAIGAMARAVGKPAVMAHLDPDYLSAATSLARTLGAPNGTMDIIEGAIFLWNDAPGRTKDEVVQALRTAAGLAQVSS